MCTICERYIHDEKIKFVRENKRLVCAYLISTFGIATFGTMYGRILGEQTVFGQIFWCTSFIVGYVAANFIDEPVVRDFALTATLSVLGGYFSSGLKKGSE